MRSVLFARAVLTVSVALSSLLLSAYKFQSPTVTNLAIAPSSVIGGNSATGTVTISAAAPQNGYTVTLKSDSVDSAVSANVKVTSGNTTATFPITTKKVKAAVTTNIKASGGTSSASASLTVNPAPITIKSLTVPASLVGTNSGTGTVTLSDVTPGAVTVTLASSDHDLTVPATVSVPAGKSSATFKVSVMDVPRDSIISVTATLVSSSATKSISIIANAVATISITPGTLIAGSTQYSKGVVTLAHQAGMNSQIVVYTDNGCAQVSNSGLIAVLAGHTQGTFTISSFLCKSKLVINVIASKVTTKKAILTLNTNDLSGVSSSAGIVLGDSMHNVTITFGLLAPVSQATAISFTSSDQAVFNVPATVTIPAGQRSATFVLQPGPPLTSLEVITVTAKCLSNPVSFQTCPNLPT